ncbi:hypothetical protein ACFLSP_05030 [Bacteroidota bacterium]
MNSKGHISIYRSIRDHWVWQNRIHATWWLDILMEANYKPGAVNVEGKIISCGRGQCVRSYYSWARMWNTNYSTARRFLKLLEKDHMISVESLRNRIIRITVLRYSLYQKTPNQLSDLKLDSYKDERIKVGSTYDEKVNQLLISKSDSCKNERINLDKESESVVNNEEVFNQKNSFEKKSSSKKNLDEEFEMFTESEESKKLMFSPDKQTPYDPTH